MSKESITGAIVRVKWRSPDDGNDFTIAELRDGSTIKGNIAESVLGVGLTYTFQGQWRDDKPFRGQKQRSFYFDQLKQAEPHTRQGMVSYLSKFAPNIGPTLAGRLFDAFGGEAAKILRTDPTRAAAEISGLNITAAKEAAVELQKNAKFEEVRIHLSELFASRSFSNQLPNMCIRRWGIMAATKIRKDPFCLLVAGFPSVGFARCDAMYMQLGLRPWKLKRLMLCIWNAIRTDMEGHTWHDGRKMIELLRQQATVMDGSTAGQSSEARVMRALELGVRSGWLILHRDTSGKVWVADGENGRNEIHIAEHIDRLTGAAMADETEEDRDLRIEMQVFAEASAGDSDDDSHFFPDETTTPDVQLSKEEAIRIGRETGICQFCHRPLTSDQSVDRGYGPICARNHGLPWGEETSEESEEARQLFADEFSVHVQ